MCGTSTWQCFKTLQHRRPLCRRKRWHALLEGGIPGACRAKKQRRLGTCIKNISRSGRLLQSIHVAIEPNCYSCTYWRFKLWKLHDIESIEFQNKMLFAKQIQTRDIHKLLVITRASDCVLPLIHIYASKWLHSPSFDSNFSRRRVRLLI